MADAPTGRVTYLAREPAGRVVSVQAVGRQVVAQTRVMRGVNTVLPTFAANDARDEHAQGDEREQQDVTHR